MSWASSTLFLHMILPNTQVETSPWGRGTSGGPAAGSGSAARTGATEGGGAARRSSLPIVWISVVGFRLKHANFKQPLCTQNLALGFCVDFESRSWKHQLRQKESGDSYKDGSEKGMIETETCSEFGQKFLQILSNDDVQLNTHS